MSLPVLKPQRHTMQDVQEEHDHTLSWVQAHPAGKPYLAKVLEFQGRIHEHLLRERTLKQKVAAQVVLIYLIDQDLNAFVSRLLALLPEQGEHPPELLRSHYLGPLAPSDFIRPVLADQLENMRGWLLSLSISGNAAMQQLGKELALKIKEADEAIQGLREAEQTVSNFLAIGDRLIIFNEMNELRKTVYSGVEALRPGLGDAFFLHDTSQRQLSLEASLKNSQARFDRLSLDLAEERALLEDLKRRRAERDNQEALRQTTLQKLAELKEQSRQLKSELKQAPKKKKR
jgi:hypothetical protein